MRSNMPPPPPAGPATGQFKQFMGSHAMPWVWGRGACALPSTLPCLGVPPPPATPPPPQREANVSSSLLGSTLTAVDGSSAVDSQTSSQAVAAKVATPRAEEKVENMELGAIVDCLLGAAQYVWLRLFHLFSHTLPMAVTNFLLFLPALDPTVGHRMWPQPSSLEWIRSRQLDRATNFGHPL